MQGGIQQHHAALLGGLRIAASHQLHGLGHGGGLVQQRSSSHWQAGQILHHRLEVQQSLEAALGNLRLVGGVSGVPARVLHHVAADHGRGDRVEVTIADQLLLLHVLVSVSAQGGQGVRLVQRLRQADRASLADGLRKGIVGQRDGRFVAQVIEDLLGIGLVRADVALNEGG